MRGSYQEYAQAAFAKYSQSDSAERYLLVSAVEHLSAGRVLDIGCGAGNELLPFLEKTKALCVGVDIGAELGKIAEFVFKDFKDKEEKKKISFARADGADLPFADESFDVVLCRVALPYMNNRRTIAEVGRVLKPQGVFLLKIHAPAFYLWMIRQRAKTLNPKQIAYPLICLTGSLWHSISGRQPAKGLWKGKEIYQTRRFLEREFLKNNLRIEKELPDSNPLSPSLYIIKN